MSSNSDDLRTRLAAVREGDEVIARYRIKSLFPGSDVLCDYTVDGTVWSAEGSLYVGSELLRCRDGGPARRLVALDSHTPATPPVPTGDVIYRQGLDQFWWHTQNGWKNPYGTRRTWDYLMSIYPNGTVYVPREKGEDDD